jgi:hypothetical protein
VILPAPICRALLVGLLLSTGLARPLAAMQTADSRQLQRTMADIALLSNQLARRQADAVQIHEQLSTRLKVVRTEALQLIRDHRIDSEAEALAHVRLRYDLLLMAEIQAYMERYARKIAYYRVACDHLGYLYQQADDDLKIVNTLSGVKVEALTSQVKKVLDGYLADAQTLVIEPDTLTVESPQRIWKLLQTTP